MTGVSFRPFYQARWEEIEEAAQLHHAQLPSVLNALGLPTVLDLYRALWQDKDTLGWIALDVDTQVIGLVVGSPEPERMYDQLRRSAGDLKRLLWAGWNRPWLLAQLVFSRMSAGRLARKRVSGDIELMYLLVAAPFRGTGIGTTLVQHFIDTCLAHRYSRIVLAVDAANDSALDFYLKLGFAMDNTIREGFYRQHQLSWVVLPKAADGWR